MKQFIPVRLSHLLSHSSVGSVVRAPDVLLTVKDISHWKNGYDGDYTGRIIPYVEQVKKSLGLHCDLREPPMGSLSMDGKLDGGYYIPARIFPSWFVCTKCQLLHFLPNFYQHDNGNEDNNPNQRKTHGTLCKSCHNLLEQVSLVQVDSRGYLADVPWHSIAHQQEPCHQKPNAYEIYLKYHSKTGQVLCTRCQQCGKINLHERRFFVGYGQPWLRHSPDLPKSDESMPTAQIMPINDTRVHSAVNKRALVIPPESRIAKGSATDKLYRHPNKHELLSLDLSASDLRTKRQKNQWCHELSCTPAQLQQAANDIKNGYPLYQSTLQEKSLPASEYEAIITPISDIKDSEDFVTYHLSEEFHRLTDSTNHEIIQKFGKLILQVVAVSKLKEIFVMTGFVRGAELEGEQIVTAPDLGADVGWLPAVELYGEGIFIRLDDVILRSWETNPAIKKRTQILLDRFVQSHINIDPEIELSPRFLLLHALSHLFIKELERSAGYPAASLKEKIYSNTSPDNPMAGFLIYTTTTDVDGTLGGLVELCQPKNLLDILLKVYQKMQWCSLDPVCGAHEGQGPALLNLAACHACLLVPETSCMCGNVLLDRIFLKGNMEMGLPCVFDMIEGINDV